ncbi:hypothetical protein GCM10027568_34780 [Humibacter soli]
MIDTVALPGEMVLPDVLSMATVMVTDSPGVSVPAFPAYIETVAEGVSEAAGVAAVAGAAVSPPSSTATAAASAAPCPSRARPLTRMRLHRGRRGA